MPPVLRRLVVVILAVGLVLLLVKFTFAILVHAETIVAGTPADADWRPAETAPRHEGCQDSMEIVTNAAIGADVDRPVEKDCYYANFRAPGGTQALRFRTPGCRAIDCELLGRRLHNVFGGSVLAWSCRVKGVFSDDGSEYSLELCFLGGGIVGHAVEGSLDYDNRTRLVTLNAIEKTPYGTPLECRLSFIVRPDLAVEYVGPAGDTQGRFGPVLRLR